MTKIYKGYQLEPHSSQGDNGWATEIWITKDIDIAKFIDLGPFKSKEGADSHSYSLGAQVIDGKHPDPAFKIDF